MLLEVADLRISFPGERGELAAVDGVSFAVAAGERIGIVGESGSGKSLTALAVAGLLPHPGQVASARLRFQQVDLSRLTARGWREQVGTGMAMVYQDPMTSLNPSLRIGRQLSEVAEVHDGASRSGARERAVQRLRDVQIQTPARRAQQYPHELSGGMRQRAMIAMGLMGTPAPALIVADEPTTALDVTIQRQVLDLLLEVNAEHGSAILLISHDIAVVTQACERVIVMYAGMIVEDLPADRLGEGAAHPYTRALLAALPDLDTDRGSPLATIPGRQPAPGDRPAGCPFAPRCAHASERCRSERPALDGHGDAHRLACWHPQTTPRIPESSHERA